MGITGGGQCIQWPWLLSITVKSRFIKLKMMLYCHVLMEGSRQLYYRSGRARFKIRASQHWSYLKIFFFVNAFWNHLIERYYVSFGSSRTFFSTGGKHTVEMYSLVWQASSYQSTVRAELVKLAPKLGQMVSQGRSAWPCCVLFPKAYTRSGYPASVTTRWIHLGQ